MGELLIYQVLSGFFQIVIQIKSILTLKYRPKFQNII
jgi:hypothetical protein